MRGALAVALAGAALVGSAALLVQSTVCGYVAQDAVEPGQPAAPSRCVPAVSPVAGLLVLLVALATLGAVRGMAWPPLTLGAVFLAVSVPLGLSIGPLLWPLAALLLGAGLLLARPRRGAPA